MVVKLYISGISGNKEVKKKQQRVQMILESKSITYEAIDITEPGREKDKEMMQQNATVREVLGKHPLPPQIFNEADYCGDYEDFDLANENDELEAFLHLPIPSKLTSAGNDLNNDKVNGSREDAAESQGVRNGAKTTEVNGDVELTSIIPETDVSGPLTDADPAANEDAHDADADATVEEEVVNNPPTESQKEPQEFESEPEQKADNEREINVSDVLAETEEIRPEESAEEEEEEEVDKDDEMSNHDEALPVSEVTIEVGGIHEEKDVRGGGTCGIAQVKERVVPESKQSVNIESLSGLIGRGVVLSTIQESVDNQSPLSKVVSESQLVRSSDASKSGVAKVVSESQLVGCSDASKISLKLDKLSSEVEGIDKPTEEVKNGTQVCNPKISDVLVSDPNDNSVARGREENPSSQNIDNNNKKTSKEVPLRPESTQAAIQEELLSETKALKEPPDFGNDEENNNIISSTFVINRPGVTELPAAKVKENKIVNEEDEEISRRIAADETNKNSLVSNSPGPTEKLTAKDNKTVDKKKEEIRARIAADETNMNSVKESGRIVTSRNSEEQSDKVAEQPNIASKNILVQTSQVSKIEPLENQSKEHVSDALIDKTSEEEDLVPGEFKPLMRRDTLKNIRRPSLTQVKPSILKENSQQTESCPLIVSKEKIDNSAVVFAEELTNVSETEKKCKITHDEQDKRRRAGGRKDGEVWNPKVQVKDDVSENQADKPLNVEVLSGKEVVQKGTEQSKVLVPANTHTKTDTVDIIMAAPQTEAIQEDLTPKTVQDNDTRPSKPTGIPHRELVTEPFTAFSVDKIAFSPQLVSKINEERNAVREEKGVPLTSLNRRPSDVDLVKQVRMLLDERDTEIAYARARQRAGYGSSMRNPHQHFLSQINQLINNIEEEEDEVYVVVHPPPPPKIPSPEPPVNEFIQEVLRALNGPYNPNTKHQAPVPKPPPEKPLSFLKQVKVLLDTEKLSGDGHSVFLTKERGPLEDTAFVHKVRDILAERETSLGIERPPAKIPEVPDHSEFLQEVLVLLNDEPMTKEQAEVKNVVQSEEEEMVEDVISNKPEEKLENPQMPVFEKPTSKREPKLKEVKNVDQSEAKEDEVAEEIMSNKPEIKFENPQTPVFEKPTPRREPIAKVVEKSPPQKDVEVALVSIGDKVFPVIAKIAAGKYRTCVSSLGSKNIELTTEDLEAVTITVVQDNGHRTEAAKIIERKVDAIERFADKKSPLQDSVEAEETEEAADMDGEEPDTK